MQSEIDTRKTVFEYPIEVDSSCIDVLEHTNNKMYLAWMEEAALAHSESLGWSVERYLDLGQTFVVKKHWMNYLRPTFLGEQLVMKTWVATMEESLSWRRFALFRGKKACFLGSTLYAFVDRTTGRSVLIPPAVSGAFPIVSSASSVLVENRLHLYDFPDC
jgi:acyl-CoA thioester hydrolase